MDPSSLVMSIRGQIMEIKKDGSIAKLPYDDVTRVTGVLKPTVTVTPGVGMVDGRHGKRHYQKITRTPHVAEVSHYS